MEGVSHQDQPDVVLGSQAVQGGQIGPDIDALQRGEPLRGEAQWVAQRQSDPLFSQIQG
jgi:hypothetical protein